eukprot:scaffold2558_cov172-Amphora_coffeaeformis.AAC.1
MSTNEESSKPVVFASMPATPGTMVQPTTNGGATPTTILPPPTTTSADGGFAASAVWPYSCPPPQADLFLTINCGNTHLLWAIHEGSYKANYHPIVFWKTGQIDRWDKEKESRYTWLANWLPPHAFKKLFGTDRGPTPVEVIALFAARKVSMCPVYIVSTNDSHLQDLLELLKTIPTRVTFLRADDFGLDPYEGCGLDRVANLKGAESMYESPALVIDGGTALTWTSTTGETPNRVRGGGIAAGFAMRFKALHAFTEALPDLSSEEVLARINECKRDRKAIKLYADNTKDAMITAALRESALLLAHITRAWVKERLGVRGKKGNATHVVCLTGGDAVLFEQLLTGTGHMLQTDKDGLNIPKEATIVVEKNLIHHGISAVLMEKTTLMRDMNELERARVNSIGKRVVIQNDTGLMRGTIVDVARGNSIKEDKFTVSWDDHTIATFDVTQVSTALIAYAEKGENDEVNARIEAILDDFNEEKGFLQPPISKQGLSKYASDWICSLLEGKSFELVAETIPEDNDDTKQPAKRKPEPSSAISNKKARKEAQDLPIDKDSIMSDPRGYVHRRVAKFFDDDLYFGRVRKYDPKVLEGDTEMSHIWKVTYDDGDKEEYDIEDMVEFLSIYKENEIKDPKA